MLRFLFTQIFKLTTTALARIEMEILFPENLFFLERAERPEEAPDGS